VRSCPHVECKIYMKRDNNVVGVWGSNTVLTACQLGFVELCAKILQIMRNEIMRALFANYAHILRTFIGLVLHTLGIQNRQCDIIWCISQTCYFRLHRLSSTTQDVMSRSDWLLFSHLPVLTTATSSLWISWCPVHISAAAVSPSCGNTYWSRPLHYVNSTGFQSLWGYSVSCVCCYTTHLLATIRLRGICHSCWPVSGILSRSALRSVRNSDFDFATKDDERAFCIAALLEYSVHSWL